MNEKDYNFLYWKLVSKQTLWVSKWSLDMIVLSNNIGYKILYCFLVFKVESSIWVNVFLCVKMSAFWKKSGYPSYPEKPLSMAWKPCLFSKTTLKFINMSKYKLT